MAEPNVVEFTLLRGELDALRVEASTSQVPVKKYMLDKISGENISGLSEDDCLWPDSETETVGHISLTFPPETFHLRMLENIVVGSEKADVSPSNATRALLGLPILNSSGEPLDPPAKSKAKTSEDISQVAFMVSKEEYTRLRSAAARDKLSMAGYVKQKLGLVYKSQQFTATPKSPHWWDKKPRGQIFFTLLKDDLFRIKKGAESYGVSISTYMRMWLGLEEWFVKPEPNRECRPKLYLTAAELEDVSSEARRSGYTVANYVSEVVINGYANWRLEPNVPISFGHRNSGSISVPMSRADLEDLQVSAKVFGTSVSNIMKVRMGLIALTVTESSIRGVENE